MSSKKLLAAFGATDPTAAKQEEIPSPTVEVDLEVKAKDDDSSEEDWVKVEDVTSSESSLTPVDKEPPTEIEFVKDEVVEQNESTNNDNIKEIVETLNVLSLVKEEPLQVEPSMEPIVEPSVDNAVVKDEVDDNGTRSIDENTKQPLEQDKDNKENSNITAGKEDENVEEPEEHAFQFINSEMPPSYPMEKIVVVTNILPRFDKYELAEAFLSYGKVTYIQKMKNYALVAYSKAEEALSAARDNNKIKIKARPIGIRVRDMDKRFREYHNSQIVFVFDLIPFTSDRILRKHFAECGKITSTRFYRCRNGINRLIIFENRGSADAALELDGTTLDSAQIRVRPRYPRAENYYEGLTVVMFNENGFEELAKSELLELFKDCGEIDDCDILCNIKKLAMITFKEESGADNAMKLNGTIVGKFKVRLEPYTDEKYRLTKIMIHNLSPEITSFQLMSFFNKEVVVDKIYHKMGNIFALMEVENTDEFCNAFRLSNTPILGQDIVLKPVSDKDESLEGIVYGNDDWVGLWGDKKYGSRNRKRRQII